MADTDHSRHDDAAGGKGGLDCNDLVLVGGSLDLATLTRAYANGVFPWFDDHGDYSDTVLWWSPDPRTVIMPSAFHCSGSLRRRARDPALSYRVDGDFPRVLHLCGNIGDRGANGGWLGPRMERAYRGLHEAGLAHSFEVRQGGELAGGVLYVQMGCYVAGESMFSALRDGSKLALREMCSRLARYGEALFDCQVPSAHLASLGAVQMPRDRFRAALGLAAGAGPADLSAPPPDG